VPANRRNPVAIFNRIFSALLFLFCYELTLNSLFNTNLYNLPDPVAYQTKTTHENNLSTSAYDDVCSLFRPK